FQANINESLEKLGTFLGVDAIALYEYSRDADYMQRAGLWSGPSFDGLQDAAQDFRPQADSWWIESLRAGEPLVIDNLTALSGRAEDLADTLTSAGLKRLLAIPFMLQ